VSDKSIDFSAHRSPRYHGTDFAMAVPPGCPAEMEREFRQQHLRRYGFAAEDKPPQLNRSASKQPNSARAVLSQAKRNRLCEPVSTTKVYSGGKWVVAYVYQRTSLKSATPLRARACNGRHEHHSGRARLDGDLNDADYLLLAKAAGHCARYADADEEKPDPAKLELFNNLFTAIAEEMGLQLQNTSHSVNIKERLDSPAPSSMRRATDRQRPAHSRSPRLDGRERAESFSRSGKESRAG